MFKKIRYILLILLLIVATQATGQYIIDKVCVGSVRYYRVDGEAGSTYIWTLTDPLGNQTILPSTADTVAITWNTVPGSYKLSTIQHSVITGCDGLLEIGDIVVYDQPLAFAGNPMIFCTPGPYTLSEATASHYSSLLWTTSGDGTFNIDTILNPIYTPGTGDLGTGTVTLTLTATGLGFGNACTPVVSSVVVHQSAAVVAVTAVSTPVSCYGGNDGTATAIPTGGTGVYTCRWDDPASQTTITATGLYAGIYTVIVTDENGCSDTTSVAVTQPAAALTVTATSTPVSCHGGNDGTATAIPAGGTLPYTYLWNNGQTTNPAVNLNAGTYTVVITDSNSCTATVGVIVTEPAASLQATIVSQTNVSCFGYADGSATVGVTGGTPPYTYVWNTTPVQTGPTAINLGPGTYVVIVTDTNHCTTSDTVIITEPPSILANAGPDGLICETETFALSGAVAANYSAIAWATSGDGSFDDATVLNPLYTPGFNDILTGNVILTITAFGLASCPDSSDSMILSISRQATVYAGPDDSICANQTVYPLSGAVADHFTSLLWTTSGTGTFSDNTIQNPAYTVSSSDISAGQIWFVLTATSMAPCVTVIDSLALWIIPQVIASAGPDTFTCQNVPALIAGSSASNYSSILWTHNGTGILTDETTIHPTYLAGPGETGTVTLTMTVCSLFPCTDTIIDQMILTIWPLPGGTLSGSSSVC
ncbi:MAG TPA: SprB repeat-containing protein, partial [Bacteroidales bacterium]|nr:SprB repeat-containing protein [Bacteroidales bacterium]